MATQRELRSVLGSTQLALGFGPIFRVSAPPVAV